MAKSSVNTNLKATIRTDMENIEEPSVSQVSNLRLPSTMKDPQGNYEACNLSHLSNFTEEQIDQGNGNQFIDLMKQQDLSTGTLCQNPDYRYTPKTQAKKKKTKEIFESRSLSENNFTGGIRGGADHGRRSNSMYSSSNGSPAPETVSMNSTQKQILASVTAMTLGPSSKRPLESSEDASDYNDDPLRKRQKYSCTGYAGQNLMLPSTLGTVPSSEPDMELSTVEHFVQVKIHGCPATSIKPPCVTHWALQDRPTSAKESSLLVTGVVNSHENSCLYENNTSAMRLVSVKRPLQHSEGVCEHKDVILKKRQKCSYEEHKVEYCSALVSAEAASHATLVADRLTEDQLAVRIPDHSLVTNTESSSLRSQSFESGAFSGIFPQKASDSNVELPVRDESVPADQMKARNRGYYESSVLKSSENEIPDTMVVANMENVGAPSVSQASILNLAYSNNNKPQVQFNVRVGGYSLSVQKFLSNVTVQELVESSCRRIGIKTADMYGVLGGKRLHCEDFLSCYPIYRDSVIDLRSRLRGGKMFSYDEKFDVRADDLFDYVMLPQDLVNTFDGVQFIARLASYARFNIKELFVDLTAVHREGQSFDGRFDSSDIIYYGSTVFIKSRYPLVPFTSHSCRRDYRRIRDILKKTFVAPHGGYPEDFEHLLSYLDRCPAGHLSNTEPAISFLVNHPVLEFFMDRCKQSMLLDHMLHRIFGDDRRAMSAALGDLSDWHTLLLYCPAMYDCYYRRSANGQLVMNPKFTNDPQGFLHYSNIFLKHADNILKLDQMEAALSFNAPNSLARILERIAIKLLDARHAQFRKDHPDFFHILGNDLANVYYGET